MDVLSDLMFQIDQGIQAQGYPAMDGPTLKEVHKRLQDPQAQQMIQSGKMNADFIVKEAVAGLTQMGHKGRTLQNKGLLGNANGQPAPAAAI